MSLRNEYDAQLAGLFELGCELMGQPDRPGLAYLIAHAGRELTDCVLRPTDARKSGRREGTDTTGQHRQHIAQALGLSAKHDIVVRWHTVHSVFASAAHARIPGPALAPVQTAFIELRQLLAGYFRAFYEATDALDALIDAGPKAVSIDRLRALLLRPMLRRHFFSRLPSADWIAPLESEGLFAHPPRRQTYEDGSWRGRIWPEGSYLVRMAEHDPAAVSRLLADLPDDNDNILVWMCVAQAIQLLPAEHAGRLAHRYCRLLRSTLAPHLAHDAIEVAASLARRGRPEAFEVVEHLLWWRRRPPGEDHGELLRGGGALGVLRRARGATFVDSDAWLLERLDHYDFTRVLNDVFPLLDALDPARSLDLMIDSLHRALLRVARWHDQEICQLQSSATVAGSEGTLPFELARLAHTVESRCWCPNLRRPVSGVEVRQHLAASVFDRFRARLAAGIPVQDLLQRLDRYDDEIFARMQLQLMAESETLDVASIVRLDRLLASTTATRPTYGAVEVAALLRAHFTKASTTAQHVFAAAIEAGDRADTSVVQSAEDTQRALEAWQRTRLRWFHDRIPAVLWPLADRLNVRAGVPTRSQQSLDETGRWVSGVSAAAYRSPIRAEELLARTPAEAARFVCEWHPRSADGDPFATPSTAGLVTELRRLAVLSPAFTKKLLSVRSSGHLPPETVTALLRGLRDAVEQGRRFSVRTLVACVHNALSRVRCDVVTADKKGWDRDAFFAAALDLLIAFTRRRTLNEMAAAALWDLLREFDQVWRPATDTANQERRDTALSYDAAVQASYRTPAALRMDAVLWLAWKEFLSEHARTPWPPPATTRAAERITSYLGEALSASGPDAPAVQVVLGQHLVGLLWMANAWTLSRLSQLLDQGTEQPGTAPAWTAYLAGNSLNGVVFPFLRPWYARQANLIASASRTIIEGRYRYLDESLAEHVAFACLRGLCHHGEPDALVENTFAGVSVEARNRAYWSLWHQLSEARHVRKDLRANLCEFWEGRLAVLERSPRTQQHADEVAGLSYLIATPHLSTPDLVRLGVRTIRLLTHPPHPAEAIWQRLESLAQRDLDGTMEMVSGLIDVILKADHPYVSFDDVAPPLRLAIRAGGPVRERAIALLHRIGRSGMTDVSHLWVEAKELECKS